MPPPPPVPDVDPDGLVVFFGFGFAFGVGFGVVGTVPTAVVETGWSAGSSSGSATDEGGDRR